MTDSCAHHFDVAVLGPGFDGSVAPGSSAANQSLRLAAPSECVLAQIPRADAATPA